MAPRRSTRLATSRAAAPKPVPKCLPKKPKKKRSVANKAKTGTKKRRTGLTNAINPTSALGVVDPESKINGTIQALDSEPCDVMLVLVDPQKHMDKFFVLQLIESMQGYHIVYTRWGRTGTSGQALEQSFDEYDDAVKCFEDKFAEKTGLEWNSRSHPTIGTKYRFIQQNLTEKRSGYTSATWQYWVDDGVDGKATGWYDYDPAGSVKVEQLFHENSINSRLTNRLVESGIFTYDVDLNAMTQTNVKHSNKTSRRIRRCLDGVKLQDVIPQTISSVAVPASPGKPAAIVTPSSTPIKVASGSVSPVTSSSSSPPVDSDIDKFHFTSPSSHFAVVKDEEHDEWCDVVLNQCNITGGSNNNKYYRLQLLEKTTSAGNFYTWFKWGRVGDAPTCNAQDLKGPFSTVEAAMKVFAKKYKDKTANKWGDENYVAKANKYTRIQIDHSVAVKQELKSGDVKTEDIEYLPSKLHPKTKELVEVLFSSETRDEALAAFDLDLKRLPLGVPSQQQIQAGLSILTDIEEKLNGEDITGSYPELSSAFYTSIPHSFKRNQRPPVINDKNSLQKRFDMCNILLDMYNQNETLREIEEKRPVKQVPYPADSHYDSLQAKLEYVDHKVAEWKTIKKYFDTTKNSGSLIDAWRVDRNGESQRFNKFDSLDNRRLLWHGTNIAVAAPILTSGLRIMPHSGGRVGSGIYLASMQQKSAQYTSGTRKFACMFLCEGALGKSHVIEHDDWSITKPPTGCDSILATGRIAPKTWKDIKVDKKNVSVPQSGPVDQSKNSSFYHDEFLVYDEAQVRIRYVLTVKLH